MTNLREQFLKNHKLFLTITVEFKNHFFRTFEVVETESFEKKRKLSSQEKIINPFFLELSNVMKPQRIVCKIPQDFFTFTVVVIRSTLYDLGNCWKHNFLKERQTFPWRKVFGLFLLQLSSVIKVRGQFLLVQKLVWQILWKN